MCRDRSTLCGRLPLEKTANTDLCRSVANTKVSVGNFSGSHPESNVSPTTDADPAQNLKSHGRFSRNGTGIPSDELAELVIISKLFQTIIHYLSINVISGVVNGDYGQQKI